MYRVIPNDWLCLWLMRLRGSIQEHFCSRQLAISLVSTTVYRKMKAIFYNVNKLKCWFSPEILWMSHPTHPVLRRMEGQNLFCFVAAISVVTINVNIGFYHETDAIFFSLTIWKMTFTIYIKTTKKPLKPFRLIGGLFCFHYRFSTATIRFCAILAAMETQLRMAVAFFKEWGRGTLWSQRMSPTLTFSLWFPPSRQKQRRW